MARRVLAAVDGVGDQGCVPLSVEPIAIEVAKGQMDARLISDRARDDESNTSPLEPEDVEAPPPDRREVIKCWRVDTFAGRRVDTPPWSRRPPQIEPEVGVMLHKSQQDRYRAAWEEADPYGFARQIERRRTYEEEKTTRAEEKNTRRGLSASTTAP